MFLGMPFADNWCETLTLASVFVGGVWALLQQRSSIRAQRAETMMRLFELCDQKEVYLTYNFYVLGEMKLPERFYTGSLVFADPEGKGHKPANVKARIDTMLAFFSQVCYMWKFGFIKGREFASFENLLLRLFGSSQIKAYLHGLRMENVSAFPYCLLFDYAKSKQLLD